MPWRCAGVYWAGSRSPLMAAGYLACASYQPPQCADTHAPPVHLNARPLQRRSLFYLPLQHLFHPSLSFSKPHAPRLRCPALVHPRTQPLPVSTGEGKRARLVGRCARTTRFENHTVKSSVDAPSMSGGLWCFMTSLLFIPFIQKR